MTDEADDLKKYFVVIRARDMSQAPPDSALTLLTLDQLLPRLWIGVSVWEASSDGGPNRNIAIPTVVHFQWWALACARVIEKSAQAIMINQFTKAYLENPIIPPDELHLLTSRILKIDKNTRHGDRSAIFAFRAAVSPDHRPSPASAREAYAAVSLAHAAAMEAALEVYEDRTPAPGERVCRSIGPREALANERRWQALEFLKISSI